MPTKVFLVHGWSVSETKTYQALHLKLAEHGYELSDVHLGRYVTLDNEVEIRDIARAMHRALQQPDNLGRAPWTTPFHIITHSTGALVVKQWIAAHYAGEWAANSALQNLVFLAGPHFGSRLAHHGRSMLAHARYWGDTGKQVLHALELGSRFSWDNNEAWLDSATWKSKGVRPYCLIGDKVVKSFFSSRIFPAAYEEGSDEVVRVPAGNLNFQRYRLDLTTGEAKRIGGLSGVPFGALADFTHSGPKEGIMNSIKRSSTPERHLALRLILRCLGVETPDEYEEVANELTAETRRTREVRHAKNAHAQLDFRFVDQDGAPVDDYSFALGAMVKDRRRPSKTVAHTHKNRADGSHFTAFLNLKEFEPDLTYFMELRANTHTDLVSLGETKVMNFEGDRLTGVIRPDETTQIEVVLDRTPRRELFVFHRGTDPGLHVEWDRHGRITESGIAPD